MIYGEATKTAEDILGSTADAMLEAATCLCDLKDRAERAERELSALKALAERAEAEREWNWGERSLATREAHDLRVSLTALGKDARLCALAVITLQAGNDKLQDIARRILEATKEEP